MTTLVQPKDGDSIVTLLLAVHGGREEEVKRLLTQGYDVNLADADGITPLMASAMNGNLAMACLLMEAGANLSVRNKWGLTAHAIAVWHGYQDLAARLEPRIPNLKQKEMRI